MCGCLYTFNHRVFERFCLYTKKIHVEQNRCCYSYFDNIKCRSMSTQFELIDTPFVQVKGRSKNSSKKKRDPP